MSRGHRWFFREQTNEYQPFIGFGVSWTKYLNASAKVAYEIYRELFRRERFIRFVDTGARTQKPLWASTSTKKPVYKDTRYVDALIEPGTINTVSIERLNAYCDHGHPEQGSDQEVKRAYQLLNKLSTAGIDLNAIRTAPTKPKDSDENLGLSGSRMTL
jgi:transaldolase